MSETRGIFGLNDPIDLEVYDEWVNLQEKMVILCYLYLQLDQ